MPIQELIAGRAFNPEDVQVITEAFKRCGHRFIPVLINQNLWAHSPNPKDMMGQGRSMRLFRGVASAVVEEIAVGFVDAIGGPVVAYEMPDVFLRIELGAFRLAGNDGHVGGDLQRAGECHPA